MRRRTQGAILAACMAGGLGLTGCAPPVPEDLLAAVTWAVLVPERSCEQLRDGLGLTHLPTVSNPAEAGLVYAEQAVPSPRGQMLRVWHLPAAADRGLVIVSPGAVGSAPCYLFVSRLLHDAGWSVVMYDYEGFGGSTGKPDFNSLRVDLETVLDWATAATVHDQATLLGMSLGSIPSIAVATQRPEKVRGVIVDSPVALGEEFDRFSFFFGGTPSFGHMLDPLLFSEEIIGNLGEPLLVFLHEEDEVTPARSVELLYERAGGPKELVRFPDLHHARGQFLRTEEYTAHLEAFLRAQWPNSDSLLLR